MAWTSGFFNSINSDRLYNADQMSAIFEGLITNGVYEKVGNKLAVEPNEGMTIQINTGKGWFGGKWANNDSVYLQALEESDVLLNRYCAVCVRTDLSDSVRKAEPYFKYSEFATTPVKPKMERTETIKEYCLAYVYIKAGATSISASDIEDTRSDTDLCGWVTGLIDQLDGKTLYTQFEAIFFEWFNSLGDYMDEKVETKLVNDVTKLKQQTLKATFTLDASGWTEQASGTWQQAVTVNGVTAYSDIIISPVNEDKETYFLMECEAVRTEANCIIFECVNPQSIDIAVEALIFNMDVLANLIIESVTSFTVTDDGAGAVTITD